MTDKLRYTYSVARFVPDTIRGEFVNIGLVVVNDDTGEALVANLQNRKRARCIDVNSTLPSVVEALERLSARFDVSSERDSTPDQNHEISPEGWLRQIAREYQNMLTFTAPQWILAESVHQASARLTHRFLLEPQSEKAAFLNRSSAVARLKKAYQSRALFGLEEIAVHESAAIKAATHKIKCDFVVTNGRALQIAHAFSFQIPNTEQLSETIRAWSFSIGEIRSGGATALVSANALAVHPTIDVEVVFVPPQTRTGEDLLEETRAMFEPIDVKLRPMSEASEVADAAARLAGHTNA